MPVDHQKARLGHVDDLEVARLGRMEVLAFLLDVEGLQRVLLQM
jgi:hypothetical protein